MMPFYNKFVIFLAIFCLFIKLLTNFVAILASVTMISIVVRR